VFMQRLALVILAVAASAACASTGAYSPRPFPTGPAGIGAVSGPAGSAAPRRPFVSDGRAAVSGAVLTTAMGLTGVPYRLGGSAPAVEPGDLVFFQTVGSKASHVGIAIDAQSFVHAPNSRGVVRVDRLDSAYWSGRFLGARRVF